MDRTKALRGCTWLLMFSLFLILPATSQAQLESDQVRSAATNVLFIYGSAAHTIAVDSALVRTMPQVQVKVINGDSNAAGNYSGVLLKDSLSRAQVTAAASLSLAAVSQDGNKVALSPAETDAVFRDGNEVIVADAMNQKPLGASNGPLILIILAGTGPSHLVPNLARIQVNTAK